MSEAKHEPVPARRPRYPEAFQRDAMRPVTDAMYSFKQRRGP